MSRPAADINRYAQPQSSGRFQHDEPMSTSQSPPHPLRSDPKLLHQPIHINLDYNNDTVIARNKKMFQNTAHIEIAELKDALAYAEGLLAQNLQEREAILKENNDHAFAMRREQERTRDALQATKRLESDVQDLNGKLKKMEDAKEAVSSHRVNACRCKARSRSGWGSCRGRSTLEKTRSASSRATLSEKARKLVRLLSRRRSTDRGRASSSTP